MFNQELWDKVKSMDLQDIFDTLNPFWEEALNWKRMPIEEYAGEDYLEQQEHPCGKFEHGFIPCPDCGGSVEITIVCAKSPFYLNGYRTMLMCKSDDCMYYEYKQEEIEELTDLIKEVQHG